MVVFLRKESTEVPKKRLPVEKETTAGRKERLLLDEKAR
jgi:hypothetical protein